MCKELVVACCLLCCYCVLGATEQELYKVYAGYEVTSFYEYRSVPSLTGCATYCNKTAGCFTATYDKSTKQCQLCDQAIWMADNTGNLDMRTVFIVQDSEVCLNPPTIANGTMNVTLTPQGSYAVLTCDHYNKLARNSPSEVICILGYGWENVTDMACEPLDPYYGTSFVFAYMKNDASGSSGVPTIMISSQTPTTVRLEIPCVGVDTVYTVQGTVVTQLPVYSTMTTSRSIEQKAVFVTSANPIHVSYYNYDSETTDGGVVFPTAVLGNEYFLAGYLGENQFIMVSLNDATLVTLQYPSGTTETITLNANDTYFALVNGMAGTKVSASEPIFLSSGKRCVTIPTSTNYCDQIVETMPPVTSLGTIHIVSFMKPRPGFDISIVATDDSTQVIIYDNTGNVIESMQVSLQTSSVLRSFYGYMTISVISNKPIMVHQYGHGSGGAGGDPSMMFIPDVRLFGRQYDFGMPPEFGVPNTLTVVIAASLSASLLEMNGLSLVPTQSVSVNVPGDETYLVLYVDVMTAYTFLAHQSGAAFGAWVYGRLPMAEFAWTLGYTV